MNHQIPAIALLLASILTAIPAHAETTRYRGFCDASAAVALGPRHFVVADDDRDILTIYPLGKPDATASVDLGEYLGNRQGRDKARKSDIEGAARIGNRIYWIASHARNSKGKFQEERQRLFATEVVDSAAGPTLKAATSPPYPRLLQDLAKDARFASLTAASALPPEAPGGLNIEGLAATPDGQLLIGFRNPLSAGKALLLPLKNPAAVLDQAASPVFGDLVALDLGGRGIRSIEFIASRFVIVAGPFDNGKGSGKGFALYTWSGKGADAPQRVKEVDFGGIHPEALFAAGGGNEITVLSDDGNDSCKDQNLPASGKSFRGLSVTLPEPGQRR
ncbi:MAG: DUF3616 domain-containing protein [Candidatus Accumulibacter sp.]|nr:DUF3616 domain-containing protein [Accumulibacter sp.]